MDRKNPSLDHLKMYLYIKLREKLLAPLKPNNIAKLSQQEIDAQREVVASNYEQSRVFLDEYEKKHGSPFETMQIYAKRFLAHLERYAANVDTMLNMKQYSTQLHEWRKLVK